MKAFLLCAAVFAVFLTIVTFFGPKAYGPRSTSQLLPALLFAKLPGGVLGAAEGVVLGLPLAWLPGPFEDREPPQSEPRNLAAGV